MKKSGQLTLFVIIAIIASLAIISYFFLNNQPSSNLSTNFITGKGLSTNLETIRTNIFDCIDITTEEAILITSLQGGNIEKPEKSYNQQFGFYPYYYYEGEYYIPTQKKIEDTISEYVNKNLLDCINAKDYPQKTELGPIRTTTKIQEKEVIFNIDTTITISQNNTISIIELKEKEFIQNSKLKGMIEIANYLTEYHKIDPKYYCINCLGLMAYEKQLDVDIFPFTENNTLQVIIHDNQADSPFPHMFIYLNKYTGAETSPMLD